MVVYDKANRIIKNISKILPSKHNSVFIDGIDISTISNKKLAQIMAVIPQDTLIEYDFTVFDMHMGFNIVIHCARYSVIRESQNICPIKL